MKPLYWSTVGSLVVMHGCGERLSDKAGVDAGSDSATMVPLEITAGVGIGPVQLGGRYGVLADRYGEPDDVIEYRRTFFITWDEPGIEVVVNSTQDDLPDRDAQVVSVGTQRAEGFTGPVVPGMSRAEADDVLGVCPDVIDDRHCYHPAGVYLGYDSAGLVKTVAVHPVYTLRSEPPEMLPALGLGGVL